MNLSKEKAKRLLKEIYDTALDATLTGALRGGVEPLCLIYNNIRTHAIENGWVEQELILEINEETMAEGRDWMGDVGVAAKMFLILLNDDEE